MTRYIYWLLIASSSLLVCWSVSAAQIHTDVLPSSTVNLSYVSGGQLGSMSVHNNHPTLSQFVPYSPLNGVAYTCSPLSWLSYLSNPVGQPSMRWASNRWLSISCSTQCGPLLRWTAYGDEANNEYCAAWWAPTFVTVTGSTDKIHWTCPSSQTQCRAYKGCIIQWHNVWSPWQQPDPIASTYVWWHDVTEVRVAHNKAIQLGRSQWDYGDDGLLRCVWGQFYPHAASGSLACTTSLWLSYTFGPFGQNFSLYGYHRANTTNHSPVFWLDDASINGDSVFSVQWDTSYCSNDFGCRPNALWIYDPNDNADWVYGPWPLTAGTCPYSGQIINL